MENIVPVAFCADADYGFYLPVVLQSLLDNAKETNSYHILILDAGIAPETLEIISKQIESVKNFSLQVENITVWLEKHEQSFVETGYLTKAMYGRLLLPEICADYEKVIYAEIDAVFNRDIAELFSFDLGDAYIGAVIDPLTEADRYMVPATEAYIAEVLQLTKKDYYVFSGFLLFNISSWREHNLAKQCLEFLSCHKTVFPDQDAINAVCRGKVAYLPQVWCVTVLADLMEERYSRLSAAQYPEHFVLLEEWRAAYHHAAENCIHYNGPRKPWNSAAVPFFEKWFLFAMRSPLREVYLNTLFMKQHKLLAEEQKKLDVLQKQYVALQSKIDSCAEDNKCVYEKLQQEIKYSGLIGKLRKVWRKSFAI